MRALGICAGLVAILASVSSAAEIARVRIEINTETPLSLSIAFITDKDIDREATLDLKPSAHWALKNAKGVTLYESQEVSASRKSIQFLVDQPSKDLIQALFDADQGVHLELDEPVQVIILKDHSVFTLTPEAASTLSHEMGALTPRQRELISGEQVGAYLLSRDLSDVAREVDQSDSTRAEYVASYRFLRPLVSGAPILWRAEGRLGTKSANPLNHVEFALTGRTGIAGTRTLSYRGFGEASFLGDQRLKRTTFNLSIGAEGLIPNLIDLTGRSGRLRPKPVATVQGSLAVRPQDQALFPDHRTSWEAKATLDYYVPVATKLAVSYSGSATYSDNIADKDKIRSLHSFTISYDLPLEDLKALAKWETGQHPLVTAEGKELLIGVLMERLPF